MEALTVNQIHKKYVPDVDFKAWYDKELSIYNAKKPKDEFPVWLQKKYEILRKMKEGGRTLADLLKEYGNPDVTDAPMVKATNDKTEKTKIMGMTVPVFAVVSVVVIGLVGFGIYKLAKAK